jgi:hypothetical protein
MVIQKQPGRFFIAMEPDVMDVRAGVFYYLEFNPGYIYKITFYVLRIWFSRRSNNK